jgi:hypothetical protein
LTRLAWTNREAQGAYRGSFSGAMSEATLWLARSEDRERDLAATTAVLDGLLGSPRARLP